MPKRKWNERLCESKSQHFHGWLLSVRVAHMLWDDRHVPENFGNFGRLARRNPMPTRLRLRSRSCKQLWTTPAMRSESWGNPRQYSDNSSHIFKSLCQAGSKSAACSSSSMDINSPRTNWVILSFFFSRTGLRQQKKLTFLFMNCYCTTKNFEHSYFSNQMLGKCFYSSN